MKNVEEKVWESVHYSVRWSVYDSASVSVRGLVGVSVHRSVYEPVLGSVSHGVKSKL